MKMIDIQDVKLDNAYLHYTNRENLPTIEKFGLLPMIGENSKGLEKTKKIFFTVGEKGALVIMDVWLKWLALTPSNRSLYRLGAYLMPTGIVPNIVYNAFYSFYAKSEKRRKLAEKEMRKILKESVWLVLDLKEGEDFSFDDIDEVKSKKIPRKFLKIFYQYDSDVMDKKMEYWNMHTFSDSKISPEKIKLLRYNNKIDVESIMKYFVAKNSNFVNTKCHMLKELLLRDD